MAELQEKERSLAQREMDLNEQLRSINNRRAAFGYGSDPYAYTNAPSYAAENYNTSLQEAASRDGITVYAAGKTSPRTTNEPSTPRSSGVSATYNVGATLFKAAFIIFCIIAFESMSVFFALDYLKVSSAYPIVVYYPYI